MNGPRLQFCAAALLILLLLAGCGDDTEPVVPPVIELDGSATLDKEEGAPVVRFAAEVQHHGGPDVYYTVFQLPHGVYDADGRYYSFGLVFPADAPLPFRQRLASSATVARDWTWDGFYAGDADEPRLLPAGEYTTELVFAYREHRDEEPTLVLKQTLAIAWPGR